MSISNTFRYMCTIFTENITPVLKTELPLRRTGIVFLLKTEYMYREMLEMFITFVLSKVVQSTVYADIKNTRNGQLYSKKIQTKLATTCNKNEQQQYARRKTDF
jgi:hypothetical protein